MNPLQQKSVERKRGYYCMVSTWKNVYVPGEHIEMGWDYFWRDNCREATSGIENVFQGREIARCNLRPGLPVA
jgi:hypothetical protein